MLGHAFPRNDGPAWLAVRSRRPVSLWTTHFSSRGVVLTTSEPIYPDDSLAPQDRVAKLSEQLYEQAEGRIRQHPEAWACWSYLSGVMRREDAASRPV
jgi:hypothetical protein